MQRFKKALLTLALILSMTPIIDRPASGQETRTIWVAHHRVDCIGVGPQKCYLIKETQYEDWRFWYGEIAGFDYEDGYAYELLVAEERVENPPADAAAIELRLVKVLLKVETFETQEPDRSPPPEPEPVPPTPEPTTEPPAPVPATPAPEPEVLEPQAPEPAQPVAVEPAPPAPPSPAVPESSPGQVHRGHLSIGSGVEARSFKLCGAAESLWVEDRTDSDLWGLYRRLTGFPNRPLFMEVRGEVAAAPAGGFGAHFKQQILIRKVRNASVESAGCFAEPSHFAFRASGNEPSWNVEISKRGLALTEMGQEGRVLFPYSQPTFFGDQIIYRSQIRSQDPRTIVVRLRQEPCRDTMADASFSFTATVQLDDRVLTGCALEGDAEP